MSYCLFIYFEGPATVSGKLASWLRGDALQWLRTDKAGEAVEDLELDVFVPETGKTGPFDDGAGPAAILQLSSRNQDALTALVGTSGFTSMFCGDALGLESDLRISLGLFEVLATPVAGEPQSRPRTARLSFVVRYYGPAEDPAAFQKFYTANHPPILARFPNIRNVFCYVPLVLPSTDIPHSKIMLGNEVVFDDLADLNGALRSDVLVALRADSANFPPFGHSTHHAMVREKLVL